MGGRRITKEQEVARQIIATYACPIDYGPSFEELVELIIEALKASITTREEQNNYCPFCGGYVGEKKEIDA